MVLDESSDQEPDEPDPGAAAEAVEFDATSGEDLVHDIDATSGDDLVEGLPDPSEVSGDVKQTFWFLVLLLKVAIVGISLGLMLAYFWGWTTRGGLLAFAGCVALLDVAVRVRRFSGD